MTTAVSEPACGATSRRTGWRRRNLVGLCALLLSPFIAIGGYLGFLQLTGNIHVVQAGVVYRSAQLDRDGFEAVIKARHIKSILNLRGEDENAGWYHDELAAVRDTGIAHFDYGIGARSIVDTNQINEILAILRAAPKPLLIHCASGADRSGLVAALYAAKIERKPIEVAVQQLSLWFGHFPYFGSGTVAMDRSFWEFITPHQPTG